MTRRILTYTVLVVASAVVAACADVTAPKSETFTCPDGTIINTMSGERCP